MGRDDDNDRQHENCADGDAHLCFVELAEHVEIPSGIPTTSPPTGTIHLRQSNASRTLHQTRALLTTAVAVRMIEALEGDRNSGIRPIDACAKPNPAIP
ncbi:hypothetical protein [Haloarcula amylovorans]|uniref:hypothetical protein n=1 Tax=Haloarcula amylovorans TaxID=2562280 RepID=UPI001ADDE3BA|nr:hypothetical protein [Halomicroarcula amylolytica]